MYSWSNPNQSNFTAAQAQSQFQVPQAQIGTIIAALLRQKEEVAQREQQQMQDLYKGIGQAAVGYEKGQQSGQADDAANAALYGAQNPGDKYGGYTNPDVVPDYGGTNALKDYLLSEKAAPNPLDDQLTQAKINAENALASNRWTYPNNAGGGASMTPRQDINTANDAQKAAGQYFDNFDISDRVLNDPSAIHDSDSRPAFYDKNPNAKATTVPEGQYLYVDPEDGSYHYVTKDYLEQARAAQGQYQQAQQDYRSKLGVGPQPQSDQSVASPSTTGATDAHAQAVKILQDNGKPLTDANIQYVMQQLIR